MELVHDIWAQMRPGAAPALSTQWLVAAVAVSVATVSIGPIWRIARLGVTLVHELGHGLVGVLCGRKFTGLVLGTDASGHAVTRGPGRGAGLVLTTWVGYPAPAVVGAGLIAAAASGWAPPALAALTFLVATTVIRVRSVVTALVVLAVVAGLGGLWWFGESAAQAWALLVMGMTMLVGAWRHVAAVMAGPSPTSDPGALARLTRVPALLWNGSFLLVCAAATWVAWRQLAGLAALFG